MTTVKLTLQPRPIWWESGGLLAGSLVLADTGLAIVYQTLGADQLSRFGLVTITNRYEPVWSDQPLVDPPVTNHWERLGIEDPQAVRLDHQSLITYTAVSVYPASQTTGNQVPWQQKIGLFQFNNQAVHHRGWWLVQHDAHHPVLLPKRVLDHYHLIYALGPSIYLSSSRRLGRWPSGLEVLSPDQPWETGGIVPTSPVIPLGNLGWLLFYQAINTVGQQAIGFALLSMTNPGHVQKRSTKPVSIASLIPGTLHSAKPKAITGLLIDQTTVWLVLANDNQTLSLVQSRLDQLERLIND